MMKNNEEMKHNATKLSQSSEKIMSSGGDHRLLLSEETGLNSYYSTNRPAGGIIMRSSSTTSYPTNDGYNAACKVKDILASSKEDERRSFVVDSFQLVRNSLRNNFGIPSDVRIILSPSGTTSEIIFSLFALMRSSDWNYSCAQHDKQERPLLYNILIAAEEVGSGSALAAKCCHFSPLTPRGKAAEKGTSIEGFPSGAIKLVQINARNSETGKLISLHVLEEKIEKNLEDIIEKKQAIALLHYVQCSKTGLVMPRLDFVKEMKKRFGDSLLVVVDAAQIRCSKDKIVDFLDNNFCVFVTGSKFFTGSSFSGALFIPSREVLHDGSPYIPAGINDYFSSPEIDETFSWMTEKLSYWENYGLLLRWHTALPNMNKYYKISQQLRDTVALKWVDAVKKMVNEVNVFSTLDQKGGDFVNSSEVDLDPEGKTIVPVTFAPETKIIKNDDYKKVHWLLTQDLSAYGHSSEKCLIGQPVKLACANNELNVLRLALSAPIINDIVDGNVEYNESVAKHLENALSDDRIIINKLRFIIDNYQELKKL